MRPSSSTSELFGGIYARGRVAEEVSDVAWLDAMLEVETLLARALAREELIPHRAAEAIAAACRPERFDAAALGAAAADHASPVVPLVDAIRAEVGDEHAAYVHAGATSQDVLDTAAMLVARRALVPLLEDAAAATDAAAALADAHRATPIAARTLLQRARPTTFGLKAAGWMMGLAEARAGLDALRDQTLAVQMGGPVGHLDPMVAAALSYDLGLAEPVIAWHTDRARPAAVASGLGVMAGAAAKVARDVVLLAQGEVAEVREGGGPERGRSSSMAHKRNPVAAVSVLACATPTPGLVATMLAAMAQEHERAAGAWQAEWGTLTELLRLTGSAVAWARDLLEGLEVDAERMAANVEGLDGDLGASDVLVERALVTYRGQAG